MEIDPERLRVIARVVEDASGVLGQGYEARSGELAPAGGAELSTAGALRSANTLWGGLFRRVASAIDVFGDGLVAAANAHTAADRQAAARMDSADRLVRP
jgi:hypothetical protein